MIKDAESIKIRNSDGFISHTNLFPVNSYIHSAENLVGLGNIIVGLSQVEIAISGVTTTIRIMADNSNTGTVYIGKIGVLSNGSNDFVRLESGDEAVIPYNDSDNALYAISDTASQKINVGALL